MIILALHELIENQAFTLESESNFESALRLFKHHNSDFADCIIHESSKAKKCKKILSFDKKFSSISGVTLLK